MSIRIERDSELSILASMLLSLDDSFYFLSKLTVDHFYLPETKSVFLAIKKSVEDSSCIDLNQVVKNLNGNCKPSFLAEIAASPIAINRGFHVEKLNDAAGARLLLSTVCGIRDDIEKNTAPFPQLIESAREKIISIDSLGMKESVFSITEYIDDQTERLSTIKKTGLTTGLIDLDEILIGFEPGDLAIIAGRPSMGKTSLALNIAVNLARQAPGFIQSIEMPREQIADKFTSQVSGVSGSKFRYRKFDASDWEAIEKAQKKLKRMDIKIDDDGGATLGKILINAIKYKAISGVKWMIIDYLQLVTCDKLRSREEEVSMITRALKRTAKDLGIVIIILCQLNRKCVDRPSKQPELSDLRESGAIEQDADEVIMVHRDEYYFKDDASLKGKADLFLKKNRNGPTGEVSVGFSAGCASFYNLDVHNF